jgi:hypothetical protein
MTIHINLTLTVAEWEFLITLLNQELDDIEEYDELGREHLNNIFLEVSNGFQLVRGGAA